MQRLAAQHPAYGLVEEVCDQRQIMAHLDAPELGRDAGKPDQPLGCSQQRHRWH
jgi:hypothetical protein